MNRKTFYTSCFIMIISSCLFADSFTDRLQDLAMQTACIGVYSATQAGGGWYDDPHDYYTPQMMATRFKEMSGKMTRTTTFYGVCFDYAEAAYWDIENYRTIYISDGMYEYQFFLAGVDSDSNTIELSRPATKENATTIQNGVYVKTYGTSSNQNIKTHKNTQGVRAIHHSWLWIMRNDGVWFWIDPTWTDNLGYIVYGYVDNTSGEEIQLKPNEKYCVVYPDYLKNLPSAPEMGKKLSPSISTASTSSNTSSTYTSTSRNNSYSHFNGISEYVGYTWGFENGFVPFGGISAGMDLGRFDEGFFLNCNCDLLLNIGGQKKGCLVGLGLGYSFSEFLALYAGGGLGLGIDWYGDMNSLDCMSVDWKVNAGIKCLFLGFDFSYNSINGPTGSISLIL